MKKPMLFLMLGYPGAGKTTTAEVIAKLTGAVHLSSDQFHIAVFPDQTFSKEEHKLRYRALDYVTELLIKSGVSVIYDANLNRYRHREEKYRICQQYDADCRLVWVQTPKQVAEERAARLVGSDPRRPYGKMEQPMFDRLVRNIQLPKDNESFISVDGTSITPQYIKSLLPKEALQ